MNISVIIPAFNEEKSLPSVINDLPKDILNEIIVVNNNSSDSTGAVAKQLGCQVVFEARRGYGQACLTGIKQLNPQTEVVVFIDGDYSDHPDELSKLLYFIHEGYDFVLGSRLLGVCDKGAMTPQAFYGNKLACFLMRLFWGVQYSDLGPFRVIKFEALKKLLMTDQNFGWTIEMQIKAVKHGLKIKEVPVSYRKRVGKSKISGTLSGTIKAGYKILYTIFKYKLILN